MSSREATPELRHALGSPDPRTRAAAALQAAAVPGALDILIAVLEDDEPLVRLAAVRALARVPGPLAMREIIRVSTTDASPEVRAEAVAAIARALAAFRS